MEYGLDSPRLLILLNTLTISHHSFGKLKCISCELFYVFILAFPPLSRQVDLDQSLIFLYLYCMYCQARVQACLYWCSAAATVQRGAVRCTLSSLLPCWRRASPQKCPCCKVHYQTNVQVSKI